MKKGYDFYASVSKETVSVVVSIKESKEKTTCICDRN